MTEETKAPQYQGIAAKMAAVMGSLKRVEKKGHNKFHGYQYATSEDVSDAIRAGLAKQGVCFVPSLVTCDTADKGKNTLYTVHMMMRFIDGESGQVIEALWRGESMDSQDKGLNKAITAAVKYFLLKTFLVPVGDEPDTDDETYDDSQEKKGSKPRRKPPEKKVAQPQEEKPKPKVEEKPPPKKKNGKERDYTVLPGLSGSADREPISDVDDDVLVEYLTLIAKAKEHFSAAGQEGMLPALERYEKNIQAEANARMESEL